MTGADRTARVAAHGFTERQATFLTTVLLHGGMCVQRQYCAFAGIAHGQVIHNLFADLTTRRYATAYPCARRGAQIFHLHHKALYRAIGEPDSRYRRPASVARAVERLMLLDAVLATRQVTWLATEREKVAYCLEQRMIAANDLPSLTFDSAAGRTTRFFPHKLPVGVAADGKEIRLLYVVTDPSAGDFRRFLDGHRRLLQRLSPWRLVLVVPRAFDTAEAAHRHVFQDFCAPPLRPSAVDEFRWFCGMRRALAEAQTLPVDADQARFARARRAFGNPRFYTAYQHWCREGDVSLHRLLSPALHDAQQRGHGSIETLTLPYIYADLGVLVHTA